MRSEVAAVVVVVLLLGQLARATEGTPSLSLLEFLGSLVEVDDELLSPLELDDSIPAPAAEEAFGWGDWQDPEESSGSGSKARDERPREEP